MRFFVDGRQKGRSVRKGVFGPTAGKNKLSVFFRSPSEETRNKADNSSSQGRTTYIYQVYTYMSWNIPEFVPFFFG